MSDKNDGDKAYDPFEAWRSMRDANLESWSKMMIEGVNSEAYAKMSGAMLDSYLTPSGPFRDMLEKTMVRALAQLSMPSRADFAGLAQRLTNIEMRLDDLDAKLDRTEAGREPAPKQAKDRKET